MTTAWARLRVSERFRSGDDLADNLDPHVPLAVPIDPLDELVARRAVDEWSDSVDLNKGRFEKKNPLEKLVFAGLAFGGGLVLVAAQEGWLLHCVVSLGGVAAWAWIKRRQRRRVDERERAARRTARPLSELLSHASAAVDTAEGVMLFEADFGRTSTKPLALLDRALLARSRTLREQLRRRWGVTVDLGEASPEAAPPGAEPLAGWTVVSELPRFDDQDAPANRSVYRTTENLHASTSQPSDVSQRARATAGIATTVVDEAVLTDGALFVREETDIAYIELSRLRDAAPSGDRGVRFRFGRSSWVVFVNADNEVCRALREWARSQVEAEPQDVDDAHPESEVAASPFLPK